MANADRLYSDCGDRRQERREIRAARVPRRAPVAVDIRSMALHTDIPTEAEIASLLAARGPACVSIYVPTTPITSDVEGSRIAFKNAAAAAVDRLTDAEGVATRDRQAIAEALAALHDDDQFWALQAHSLAVFATPSGLRSYRVPNRLPAGSHVGDRFYVKPLLRTVTFPQAAYVLALAQGSVRLLQVSPDLPAHQVSVPEMPSDAASAVGKSTLGDRSPDRGIQGAEGQKVRLRQYARAVDHALRHVLSGRTLPLILASTQPLDGIYRAINSYPHLAAETITGSPEEVSDEALAAASRPILDGIYAAELRTITDRIAELGPSGRGVVEISGVARAATFGAVDTVLVDIENYVPGSIDDETGAIVEDPPGAEAPGDYGLIDEIARRVLRTDGHVLAVRGDEVPGGGAAAALLRYAV